MPDVHGRLGGTERPQDSIVCFFRVFCNCCSCVFKTKSYHCLCIDNDNDMAHSVTFGAEHFGACLNRHVSVAAAEERNAAADAA